MTAESSRRWAGMEFGDAQLGDKRRTRRLVEMTSQMLTNPAGKVTQVFRESAAREGAFRFLENADIAAAEIAAAARRAAARWCFGQPFVFIPIDGTSLNLTDEQHSNKRQIDCHRKVFKDKD